MTEAGSTTRPRQAVVLAGGRGERLRPITDTIPKFMFEFQGKPFLEYLVENLKTQGFSEVLLLLRYLPDAIQSHFSSGEKWGLSKFSKAQTESVRFAWFMSALRQNTAQACAFANPPCPPTALGEAKAAATLLVQTFTRLHEIEAVILRLFTPFGPWENSRRLIPHTILSALRGVDIEIINSKPQRDFVFISDVIDAITKDGEASIPIGAVMNICSGNGTTVMDVVNLTLELMGNLVSIQIGSAPPRADDIWETSGEFDNAREFLAWELKLSLEEGLVESIKWFSDNRQLATQLS